MPLQMFSTLIEVLLLYYIIIIYYLLFIIYYLLFIIIIFFFKIYFTVIYYLIITIFNYSYTYWRRSGWMAISRCDWRFENVLTFWHVLYVFNFELYDSSNSSGFDLPHILVCWTCTVKSCQITHSVQADTDGKGRDFQQDSVILGPSS